jgi:hypothetical protein
MADMEILIFIAETHGDNFLSMLPSPCVYMSILQQIVAHLTFIARKYHKRFNFVAKIQNKYELCMMNYELFRNFAA